MIFKVFRVLVGKNDTFTNCYVVADEETKIGVVIDPAGEIDKIYNYVENRNIKLAYALLTHCHADHIAGLSALKSQYPHLKVAIHEIEAPYLLDDEVTLCTFLGIPENTICADVTLKEDDVVKIGNLEAKIIHTPGHTAGGMSIVIEDAVFTGDTLFRRTYGRTDLKTSSEEAMLHSIRDKLLKLPENTIVYPGHGAVTIIREEKAFYRCEE